MVAFFSPPPFMKAALVSVFVGITPLYQSTGAITWPSGTQAGDLAVAIAVGNTAVSIPGGTVIAGDVVENSPSQSSFAFKVLAAADISTPPSITVPTNGAFYVAVYRGGTMVTKRSTNASSGANVTVPGFTKSAASRRIIAAGHDRDPGTSSTPPTGFTLRATASATFFMSAVYDLSAAAYAGADVVFNLVSPGNPYAGRGTLLEIT